MTVRTYYVSKVGNTLISKNFKVKEFQCHDGTDKVLIDDALVHILQRIRDHFGRALTITSGYRTASYNSRIGGSPTSYHVKGQACDIRIAGIEPVIVGMYAESLNVGGIGVYAYSGGFVHVDTRTARYRWLQLSKSGDYEQISKIMPTIRKSGPYNTHNAVRLAQSRLGVSQSGTFGDITETAVKTFQARKGLVKDGIIGTDTWKELFS